MPWGAAAPAIISTVIEIDRVEVLAALAEPHRLAIVDALALGDLSPTELSLRTGQSSSLLAHHLGTLERSNVIHRRTSDADGRRTYLTLAWENPLVAASAGLAEQSSVPLRPSRVLFVCSANSARSQMAAALLGSVCNLDVASAGTVPAASIHPLAIAALAGHGLAPLAAKPAAVTDVRRAGDAVIAVCDHAKESLPAQDVTLHWSLPDPARGSAADFDRTLAELRPRIDRLAAALAA